MNSSVGYLRKFQKKCSSVLKKNSISAEAEFTIPQITPLPKCPKVTETQRKRHKIPTSQIETKRKK